MRLLKKEPNSSIKDLKYSKVSDRKKIREGLRKEQFGFCAYSEIFLMPTHSVEIEHFYPKSINQYPNKVDDYTNWYLVLKTMNKRPYYLKPQYLPILEPSDSKSWFRIKFEDGLFVTVETDDIAAQNFIKFLGLNKPELLEHRQAHLEMLNEIKSFCRNEEEFIEKIFKRSENLSFITAIETEFKIDLMTLIKKKFKEK